MAAPVIQTSLSRGEIAPALWGHVDLAAFHTAASTLRNMYVGFRGGVYSRAGTRFVGRSKQNPLYLDAKPRLIRFQFSATQQYVLEFGDNYFRIITRAGYATEAAFAMTGATQSFPCVVTAPAHDFVDGDWVIFSFLAGSMIELQGNTYIVANSDTGAGTFTLLDLDGYVVDASAYTAYAGAGEVARIYTVAAPYAARDLPALKFAQSADTMSLTHPNYPPQELKRFGPLNWSIAPADFGAPIAAPASLAATATNHPSGASSPPTLPCAYAYVVTAIDPQTGAESVASPVADVVDSVDMAVTAGSIKLAWSPVAGALLYNIYRSPASYNTKSGSTTVAEPVPAGALMGYVGSSFGTEFVDSNIIPDFARTPPLHQNPFAPGAVTGITMAAGGTGWTTATASITSATGSGFEGKPVISGGAVVAVIVLDAGATYRSGDLLVIAGDGSGASGTVNVGPLTGTDPGLVSYLQQRRVYAATLNSPATYWMSQPGAFLNFDSAIPVNDSDAISSTLASLTVDGIEWMLPLPLGLVTFTQSGVWQVGAPGSFASNPAAITPSNQVAAPQGSIGSSGLLAPIQINWDILYWPPQATTLRSLTYQLVFNTYTAADISWASSHLLLGHPVVAWAYCEEPYRIVWACRDDGLLLSMTYLKEQEVIGWARHTTFGEVRDLCAIRELPNDALYLVVERPAPVSIGNPNGQGSRYVVERMDDHLWRSTEDAWCVDCGVATEPEFPDAFIEASPASGDGAVFDLSPGVADVSWVGRTIRAGGGVALVTDVGGPALLTGAWLYPAQDILPESEFNTLTTQPPGTWSLARQVTRVGGLLHFAGRNVSGLADGVPIGPLVVSTTGFVDLPFAASKIVLGRPFTVQGQSVYLDAGNPTVQGRYKTIPAVTLRIEGSAPMQAGANQQDASATPAEPLVVAWPRMTQAVPANGPWPPPYQTPAGQNVTPLYTGDVKVLIPSDWKKPGQVAWQQSSPLPLAVLAMVPEVLIGNEPEVGYSRREASQRERVR